MKDLSSWLAKEELKLEVVDQLIGSQKKIKLTGGMSKCCVALKFAEFGAIEVQAKGDDYPQLRDYIRIRQVASESPE